MIKPDRIVYLDNAATTSLHPEVLEAMMPYLTEQYMNPSAIYGGAREVRRAIDRAREQVGAAVGCPADHVWFTSGATEANNWVIQGFARWAAQRKPVNEIQFLSSEIEHKSVINVYKKLKKDNFDVRFMRTDEHGLLTGEDVAECLEDKTILVSVMAANNEVGTIEPFLDIAEACNERDIAYHCDMTQIIGVLPIALKKDAIYSATFSAHKFHGPKGVGALCMPHDIPAGFMYGGEQEFGFRPGTENVAGIVGMGKAIELATSGIEERNRRTQLLRDYLIAKLRLTFGSDLRINGFEGGDMRLPNNVNFSLRNMSSETLLLMLSSKGVYASAGSACNGESTETSHVLQALRVPDEFINGAIRMTIGEETTKSDIDYALKELVADVSILRKIQ